MPGVDQASQNPIKQPLNSSSANSKEAEPVHSGINLKEKAQHIIQEKVESLERCHKVLREFIMHGLDQIKDELFPLLFYSYLRLYLKMLDQNLPREYIGRWKSDFIHVEAYVKELNLLDTFSQYPTDDEIKANPTLSEILGSSRTITVSQFTFESLFLFMQQNNLQELDFDVLQDMKINLKIWNEDTSSSNLAKKSAPSINIQAQAKEVLNVTESNIRPGIRKDEALSMHLLQNIRESLIRSQGDEQNGKFIDHIPAFNMTLQTEETIPILEKSMKYQVDFARAFLNRSISDNNQPNVLHVSVKDPSENITCMEIESLGNLLLLGFNDARILLIVLNRTFEKNTKALENVKKEFFEEIGISFTAEDETSLQEKSSDVIAEQENGKIIPEEEEKQTQDEKYQIIEFLGHEEAITSLSIHYDEQYFLSGSSDTTIRLWCIRRRECLGIYKGHINTIWTVRFAPRGFYFASGSSDSTARLWSTSSLFPIRTLVGHSSDIHLVEFFNDCNYLATASHDKSVRIWELNNSECIRIIYPGNEFISVLKIDFFSKILVTGLEDGRVFLWDLFNDKKIIAFEFDDESQRLNSIDLTPDGKFLVATSRKKLNCYDLTKLQNRPEKSNIIKSTSLEKELLNSLTFLNENQDYSLFSAKFSAGGFIYALSRSRSTE